MYIYAKFKLKFTGLRSRGRKEPHVFGPLKPEPGPLKERKTVFRVKKNNYFTLCLIVLAVSF